MMRTDKAVDRTVTAKTFMLVFASSDKRASNHYLVFNVDKDRVYWCGRKRLAVYYHVIFMDDPYLLYVNNE